MRAVQSTEGKQLIVEGGVTEVCVGFVTLSDIEAGNDVFAVAEASGTFDKSVQREALSRTSSADAQLMNGFSVACEIHLDWRNDMEGLGRLLSEHIPNDSNLMTNYFTLQQARNG